MPSAAHRPALCRARHLVVRHHATGFGVGAIFLVGIYAVNLGSARLAAWLDLGRACGCRRSPTAETATCAFVQSSGVSRIAQQLRSASRTEMHAVAQQQEQHQQAQQQQQRQNYFHKAVVESLPAARTPLVGDTAEDIWRNAAGAALDALYTRDMNATTLLLPSGAAEVVVGMQVVAGLAHRWHKPGMQALIALPVPLLRYAVDLYRGHLGDGFQVVTVGKSTSAVNDLSSWMTKTSQRIVVLCSYEDMQRVSMAQHMAGAGRIDLIVFEMAHIVRAGGYREAGLRNEIIKARKRLYVSSRRLAGLAPGALLAPGQDRAYPEAAPASRFGPEVFRMTHEDMEERNMTVPIQLAFLRSANATDVARELAELHRATGIRRLKVVPEQRRLIRALNKQLVRLTDGACSIAKDSEDHAAAIDAVIVAGTSPGYVGIAQEFARLARWEPGKRGAYLLVASGAKSHAVAAWQSLAIENQDAEEAIQRCAVETGHIDRFLTWEEIPFVLRAFLQDTGDDSSVDDNDGRRERATFAVNRAVKALGDPWDFWLGRLAAFREKYGHVRIRFMSTVLGHALGFWVGEQRNRWTKGLLEEHKVERLKRMGLMLDLDNEVFAQGLAELRKYVEATNSREVPLSYKSDAGFMLGKWVVEQRTQQRRGKLTPERQRLLKEAFFLWRPSEPDDLADHPEDPAAAMLTRQIEDEIRKMRWHPISHRRRFFRSMVLKHHPDISQEEHAGAAIQFLSDVKDWFLAGH